MSEVRKEVLDLLLKDISSKTLTELAKETVTGVLDSYSVQREIEIAIKPEITKAVAVIVQEDDFKEALKECVRSRLAIKIEVLTISVLDELVRVCKTNK
jgi:ribosomal protein S3AE